VRLESRIPGLLPDLLGHLLGVLAHGHRENRLHHVLAQLSPELRCDIADQAVQEGEGHTREEVPEGHAHNHRIGAGDDVGRIVARIVAGLVDSHRHHRGKVAGHGLFGPVHVDHDGGRCEHGLGAAKEDAEGNEDVVGWDPIPMNECTVRWAMCIMVSADAPCHVCHLVGPVLPAHLA
jgi:hypothetical protein